jgi:signal transduction histidine kinase/DNA-binding response OmpR family regulator
MATDPAIPLVPGVVKIDLSTAIDGIAAVAHARRSSPLTPIVAVLAEPSPALVLRALEAGADACAPAASGPAFEVAAASATSAMLRRLPQQGTVAAPRTVEDESRRILELLLERAPLPHVLGELCRIVEGHIPGARCSIVLVDADGILRHGAAPSLPDAFNRAVEGTAIGAAVGSCGTAAHRGAAVIVPDILTSALWADYVPLARAHGLRACWSTPIIDPRGRVLATFAVYHGHPYEPGPRDMAVVDLLARCVGLAILRERDEARRAAAERATAAQRAVASILAECDSLDAAAPRVMAAIGEGIGWDAGSLFIVDGDHLRCRHVWHAAALEVPRFLAATVEAALPRGRGLSGGVWSRGEPAWIEDLAADASFVRAAAAAADGLRSGFALPLLLGREVIGVLELFSRSRHAPDEDLLAALSGLGGQLGHSIRRWRAEAERGRLLQVAEEAGRAKDEFLAILSHELRTPLTSILGWARLLRDGKLDAAGVQRGLDALSRNAQTQARLINDILDVSRIIAGKLFVQLEPIADLGAVVERVVDGFQPEATQKGVKLGRSLGAPAPILGDVERLQQVVRNLVANAIKFTPAGGSVDVACERRDGWVEVHVRDTGHGIPADFIPRAFERFHQADSSATRRSGGLGLGLAIVRHLVELHRGTVAAASPGPGRGTTLSVRIPIHAEAARPAPLPAASSFTARPLAGLRILTVEDDADATALVTQVLAAAGGTVRSAATVRSGLELAGRETFDLVLADMRLPDGDGFELARSLSEAGFRGPIAALTAAASDHDRRRALDAGFAAHIAKPVEPDTLVRSILALAAAASAPEGDRRRLLIVEDDPDTVEILREVLAHPRIELHVCTDGLSAVERAWSAQPHVILLDHMLPGRSGFDLFVELRRASFAPRIVLLSAHAPAETFALAEDLGAYLCLRKPFDATLRGKILGALDVPEDATAGTRSACS